jgi:DHA2 family multidrug resistance protein
MGYPVLAAGLVTAPRGIGTWVSMVVVGRLTGKVDARLLIAIGFGLGAISLAWMGAFSPQIDSGPIIWSGVIQGFGTGLAYVSLTVSAFVTLPQMYRNEGTAFFNLMRNVGSSIGISLIQAYVTNGQTRAHAYLTETLTPYAPTTPDTGLVALNQQVVTQASWISYLNAFHLMMILTLVVIPLIFFARSAKPAPGTKPMIAE